MKKVFNINATNNKPGNQLDSIRHEIKKYFARERRKKLPTGFDTWVFDCKFGNSAKDATVIKESDIKERISEYASEGKKMFYLEIMAKPSNKPSNKSCNKPAKSK